MKSNLTTWDFWGELGFPPNLHGIYEGLALCLPPQNWDPNPQDAAAVFQEAPAPTILAQNIDDKMVQIDTWRILKRRKENAKDPQWMEGWGVYIYI